MTHDPKANQTPGGAAVSDEELDILFAAARSMQATEDELEPSPALLAAIMDDAERVQPMPLLSEVVPSATRAASSLSNVELESIFAAARSDADRSRPDLTPSDGLLAAIMDDAERLQPARPAVPAASVSGGLWAEMKDVFGGWFGLGGLVAASVTGLVIGIGVPEATTDVTAYLGLSDEIVDAYGSGFDLLLEEG